MIRSQRDEDLRAFTEWETTGSCGMSDVWLAALEYERERVKREECPLESWECKKLERELRAEIKELRETLEWYADRFDSMDIDLDFYSTNENGDCAWKCGGDKARAVLKKLYGFIPRSQR